MITRYDIVYMKMASEWGQLSNARRKKVGALLVKNNTIIADGYNGTPSGFENECENPLFDADGKPITSFKKFVILPFPFPIFPFM